MFLACYGFVRGELVKLSLCWEDARAIPDMGFLVLIKWRLQCFVIAWGLVLIWLIAYGLYPLSFNVLHCLEDLFLRGVD